MNVSLNASINTAIPSIQRTAPLYTAFKSYKSQPGDVVISHSSKPNDVSMVRNTPDERKQIRAAIASHLPKYFLWTGYIGDVNRHFGVNHYWEIPSARIGEALSFIASMFENAAPLFPSYSQNPAPQQALQPAPVPENWENARYELEAVLSQFENYRKWFNEQADLMDFAITSINRTLAAIK